MASKRVLSFHRWIALVFAPFLLLQALTGSALLFRSELSAVIEPARSTPQGETVSVSALYNAARDLRSGVTPTRIFLPGHPDGAAFAHLSDSDGTTSYAMIDPGNAAVIAEGGVWRFPLQAALNLHYQLNAGQAGMLLVCIYGTALAILALTGLWHWWPGRRRALKSLKIPARTPQRLKLQMWHRSTGAVTAIGLIVVAVTGVLTAVPSLAISSLWTTTPAPAASFPYSAEQIDSGIAMAQAEFPQGRLRDIRFRPDGSLAVNFRAPRDGPWAVDTVTVDPAKPDAISAMPTEANDALWTITYPLHTGTIIGPLGRYLILALAAALVFLAISGPLQWWRARTYRKFRA